ncbi:MAG: hypothetical protein FH753_09030 [Firmicutes bacterium]|nr:hypothetical protein [Bacillota bacterium]
MKGLERKEILNTIFNTLQPLEFVYGMWECGSAAFNRLDMWSDIDIVINVEDEKTKEVFKYIDRELEMLAPIEYSLLSSQPLSPGAYQKAYKLKGVSRFLIIEICALKHSSSEKFLEKEIHNEVYIHFDKKNVCKIKPIDKDKFSRKLESRIENLESLFKIYQILIEKELNRENYIEAISFYQNFSLKPLLEVLRIKYKPFRYNFNTRYIYYDLPKDIVYKLKDFYFIKDNKDLKVKHEKIKEWFYVILEELKDTKIKDLL